MKNCRHSVNNKMFQTTNFLTVTSIILWNGISCTSSLAVFILSFCGMRCSFTRSKYGFEDTGHPMKSLFSPRHFAPSETFGTKAFSMPITGRVCAWANVYRCCDTFGLRENSRSVDKFPSNSSRIASAWIREKLCSG